MSNQTSNTSPTTTTGTTTTTTTTTTSSTTPSTTRNSSKTTRSRSQSNKVTKCFKAPYRVLLGARDFYVRCFTGCAGRSKYGSMMGNPVRSVSAVPRGFSFHSQASNRQEDIHELIRAASRGSLGRFPGQSPASSTKDPVVPRSQSVAIGRIDEDQPCEFGDDAGVMGLPPMYPRSRSCAVVSKRKVGIVA